MELIAVLGCWALTLYLLKLIWDGINDDDDDHFDGGYGIHVYPRRLMKRGDR